MCRVSQGLVLGLILFTIYTSSLGLLLHSQGMHYQFYVNDSRVYTIIRPQDIALPVEQYVVAVSSCGSTVTV